MRDEHAHTLVNIEMGGRGAREVPRNGLARTRVFVRQEQHVQIFRVARFFSGGVTEAKCERRCTGLDKEEHVSVWWPG